MGSGSLSTGRKPWEYQNSSRGCGRASVYKLKCETKKKAICVCGGVGFAQISDHRDSSRAKLRVEKLDWEESNSLSVLRLFPDYSSSFFYMLVNAPSVFMMLEYNWYGQVSETDAPAVTEK